MLQNKTYLLVRQCGTMVLIQAQPYGDVNVYM